LLLDETELEDMRRLQLEALKGKLRAGKSLRPEELRQLGLAEVPVPAAAEGVADFAELELGSIREIADWWGTSQRTVERHRPKGCPFRRPWEMEGWWRGSQERNPPPWMRDGIERWRRSVGGKVAVSEVALAGEGYSFAGTEDWPIEEQLRLARKIARAYGERVEELASRGLDFAAEDRRYQLASGKLRSLEKDAPRISIEQGRAWAKEEVAGALTDVGTAMNAALDRFALTVAPKCAGKTEAEIVAIVEREVNRLRQPWSRMDFFTAMEGGGS
jgi:hypothetical protein